MEVEWLLWPSADRGSNNYLMHIFHGVHRSTQQPSGGRVELSLTAGCVSLRSWPATQPMTSSSSPTRENVLEQLGSTRHPRCSAAPTGHVERQIDCFQPFGSGGEMGGLPQFLGGDDLSNVQELPAVGPQPPRAAALRQTDLTGNLSAGHDHVRRLSPPPRSR